MVVPIDPTSAGFLFAENRQMPMHVGGLQLFEKPEGAPRDYARKLYETMSQVDEIAPLFLKRPTRGITTAGQWVWTQDENFDLEYHFRHSALPKPGRDPRAARAVLAAAQHPPGPGAAAVGGAPDRGPARRPGRALHQAAPLPGRRHLGDAADAERDEHRPRQARHAADVGRAGPARRPEGPRRGGAQPGRRTPRGDAFGARHHRRRGRAARGPDQDAQHGLQNETSALSLYAPRTMFNTDDHRLPPLRGRGLADRAAAARSARPATPRSTTSCWRCAPGAIRTYLIEHDALPDSPLVSMVPGRA